MTVEAPAREQPPHQREGPAAWIALACWILLAGTAGAAGGVASLNAREFYSTLMQPGWAPPGWLFGPVWSVLYLLMGIAAWLVWRVRPAGSSAARARARGLQLFVGQLVLNALWTWLFFAWRHGALAFAEIVLLWCVIAMTIREFSRIRRSAAWCLVPYIIWVSFATALTWAMWRLNPGLL
ncbi:tryptophan-rich sensory protein [soil metagenome]